MKKEIILCVDDEIRNLDALKMVLITEIPSGIVIENAINAENALRIASQARENGDEIILVIADQRMPGMSGEKLLAELHKSHPNTLKILLTGYTDIKAIQYAINHAGLYRYIEKPWDIEDLILTVNEAIKKYYAHRQLEEKTLQLINLNEELERKVNQRTADLMRAVKELEAFSYTISHDLKSPLRSIEGYTRFIIEDYGDDINEDAKNMLLQIRTICSNMCLLIERLLQFAITSQTQINRQDLHMDEIIKSIFHEVKHSLGGQVVKLNINSELPVVKADKVLMKQVIYNLLNNAIKFSRHKDVSIISVEYKKYEGFYTFQISDNGIGFDMQFAHKLFGIFQRLHSQNEFEGNGIGLATVKNIIERHGGYVSIEGIKGGGATVYFSLPSE